jgi:hypothetical protein
MTGSFIPESRAYLLHLYIIPSDQDAAFGVKIVFNDPGT